MISVSIPADSCPETNLEVEITDGDTRLRCHALRLIELIGAATLARCGSWGHMAIQRSACLVPADLLKNAYESGLERGRAEAEEAK